MADIGSIFVKIVADTSGVSKGLTEVQKELTATEQMTGRLGNMMKSIGPMIAGAFTVGAITNFFKKGIESAEKFERAMAKVTQGVRATGMAAGFTDRELLKMAKALKTETLIGTSTILNDVTAQLLSFKNIQGENFAEAQKVILDVATLLDNDFKGTAIQIGKALNEPTQALAALTRSGIQFTVQQREQIKYLSEHNRLAEAQKMILAEVTTQYGGQAKAIADLDSSAIKRLELSWAGIRKEMGERLLPTIAKIATALNDIIAPLNKPISEQGWLAKMLLLSKITNPRWTARMRQELEESNKEDAEDAAKKAEAKARIAALASQGLADNETKIDTIREMQAEIDRLTELQADNSGKELESINQSIAMWTKKKEALEKAGVPVKKTDEDLKKEAETVRDLAGKYSSLNLQIAKYKDELEHAGTDEEVQRLSTLISRAEALRKEYEKIGKMEKLPAKDFKGQIGPQEYRLKENRGLLAVGPEPMPAEKKLSPTSIKDYQKALQEAQTTMNQTSKVAIDMGGVISGAGSQAFGDLGDQIGLLITGQQNVKGFFNNILLSISDFMAAFGKALIGAATASEIFQKTLLAQPEVALVAGIALVAGAAVVRSIAMKGLQGYKDGVIAYGPTVGVFGEYAGARTNPEIVAPLNTLKNIMGPMRGTQGTDRIELWLRGRDIYGSTKNYSDFLARTT